MDCFELLALHALSVACSVVFLGEAPYDFFYFYFTLMNYQITQFQTFYRWYQFFCIHKGLQNATAVNGL